MREGNKLLLEAENLCVSYRTGKKDLKAVDRVSFGIERGDTLGIIGESGSGKSTIVMAMLRQLDPRFASITGSVKFDGQDLLSMPEDAFKKLLWRRIAIVFQKSMNSLSPVHRIGSQFEDIYRVHEPHASKAQIRQRALELFNLVNLPERVYTLYPHELSGGMMQRLSIVLSLMFNPDLLIMDEATTALDVVTQGQILREIMKLEQGMNLTRVMITHDLSVVTSSLRQDHGALRRSDDGVWHGRSGGADVSAPLYGRADSLLPLALRRKAGAARHSGNLARFDQPAAGVRVCAALPLCQRPLPQ